MEYFGKFSCFFLRSEKPYCKKPSFGTFRHFLLISIGKPSIVVAEQRPKTVILSVFICNESLHNMQMILLQKLVLTNNMLY